MLGRGSTPTQASAHTRHGVGHAHGYRGRRENLGEKQTRRGGKKSCSSTAPETHEEKKKTHTHASDTTP